MIAFGDFDVLSFDCYGTLIDWETDGTVLDGEFGELFAAAC
jgi:hypothetical protein